MIKSSTQISSQAGFSLLEMTIALGVLGILGTFALPLLSEHRHQRAIRMTREHQDYIVKSLEAYLVQHQLLPRPINFPKNRLDKLSHDELSDLTNPSENVIGIVPYYVLGIPETVTKDGYGHYMTYIVANDACERKVCEKVYPFCEPYSTDKNNLIEILDDKNITVLTDSERILKNITRAAGLEGKDTSSYEKNYIVFALLSHGPDGPDKAESPEEEINNQANFKNYKISLYKKPYSINPNKLFRHQIVWGTQREFAGFCKTEKITSAFEKFNKTFEELKNFADVMEKSSDIYHKLEKLLLVTTGQTSDSTKPSTSLRINNPNHIRSRIPSENPTNHEHSERSYTPETQIEHDQQSYDTGEFSPAGSDLIEYGNFSN